jgi:hypothetical protein
MYLWSESFRYEKPFLELVMRASELLAREHAILGSVTVESFAIDCKIGIVTGTVNIDGQEFEKTTTAISIIRPKRKKAKPVDTSKAIKARNIGIYQSQADNAAELPFVGGQVDEMAQLGAYMTFLNAMLAGVHGN